MTGPGARFDGGCWHGGWGWDRFLGGTKGLQGAAAPPRGLHATRARDRALRRAKFLLGHATRGAKLLIFFGRSRDASDGWEPDSTLRTR